MKRLPKSVAQTVSVACSRGSCDICGSLTRRLYVDHCHATGSVRGLLCTSCNLGLGLFKDRPGILRVAAAYIEGKARRTSSAEVLLAMVEHFSNRRRRPRGLRKKK